MVWEWLVPTPDLCCEGPEEGCDSKRQMDRLHSERVLAALDPTATGWVSVFRYFNRKLGCS